MSVNHCFIFRCVVLHTLGGLFGDGTSRAFRAENNRHARFALAAVRGWTAGSLNARLRLAARLDRARQEV